MLSKAVSDEREVASMVKARAFRESANLLRGRGAFGARLGSPSEYRVRLPDARRHVPYMQSGVRE